MACVCAILTMRAARVLLALVALPITAAETCPDPLPTYTDDCRAPLDFVLLLDTSSTSGPFLDDFETFVTSFVGLFDDNVGAAGGPRIAIASYADAVRDMLLGGATLSYGTKAEILAAVGATAGAAASRS